MSQTPPNNANGNDRNPFFFTAVWDEAGVTQVALLNRLDDLETARRILTNFSPFLKSRRFTFEIDVPNRGGGSRRAGIPSESWSIVTKSCSEVFLKISSLGQVERNSISGYAGGAEPSNQARQQGNRKSGTASVTRSPKKEKRSPETRPYEHRKRNSWSGVQKGVPTRQEPISTRGSRRVTRKSTFCRQCVDRGVDCKSSGPSALIYTQCVEERLACSLKPVDPSNHKKPSKPRPQRPPSTSGFSSSSLTELDEDSEEDGSVFNISNETETSDDLEYVSGTEETSEAWEEDE